MLPYLKIHCHTLSVLYSDLTELVLFLTTIIQIRSGFYEAFSYSKNLIFYEVRIFAFAPSLIHTILASVGDNEYLALSFCVKRLELSIKQTWVASLSSSGNLQHKLYVS